MQPRLLFCPTTLTNYTTTYHHCHVSPVTDLGQLFIDIATGQVPSLDHIYDVITHLPTSIMKQSSDNSQQQRSLLIQGLTNAIIKQAHLSTLQGPPILNVS